MKTRELLKLTRNILDDLEYSHITGEWAYDHKLMSKKIEDYHKTLKELEEKQID